MPWAFILKSLAVCLGYEKTPLKKLFGVLFSSECTQSLHLNAYLSFNRTAGMPCRIMSRVSNIARISWDSVAVASTSPSYSIIRSYQSHSHTASRCTSFESLIQIMYLWFVPLGVKDETWWNRETLGGIKLDPRSGLDSHSLPGISTFCCWREGTQADYAA